MQNVIFALLLLWNVSLESLRQKCSEEPPEWMQSQIDRDLTSFVGKKVSPQSIAETFNEVSEAQGGEVACLVRIRMENGKSSVEYSKKLSDIAKERLENFMAALQMIHDAAELPDLDFLLSLAERYDRPLFLRLTKVPVFAMSKAEANKRTLLLPNGLWDRARERLFHRVYSASSLLDWEERIPIALWRGSLSEGLYHTYEWDSKSRPRLMFYSKQHPDFVDAGTIQNHYFEAMNDVWKKWMKENNFLRNDIAPEMQLAHRYLIAIDSGATPASLQWQLFSGSTLLKAESTQLEWFYGDLTPYVHYVPFRSDSADLVEKIAWLREHPEEGKQIAKNAQIFANERLTDDAIFQYTYYLLKAYAELLTQ